MAGDPSVLQFVIGGGALGLAGGLGLFVQGLRSYRTARAVEGLPSSELDSLAAGEVRVSGVVRPVVSTLVSPLQSRPCVWFRSKVVESEGRQSVTLYRMEKGVEFLVDDGEGTIRVFPRGARMDVPNAWNERTTFGDPVGLNPNRGPLYENAHLDREAAIAKLLTVQQPAVGGGSGSGFGLGGASGRARHYEEARIEPGDTVTIIGTALPFRDVRDPLGEHWQSGMPIDDPTVAAEIAEARAAGRLEATPEEAWGNAAIPGFGIGMPTREPELDPAARPIPVVPEPGPGEDGSATRPAFDIPPETLVLAAHAEHPLVIHAGTPAAATERHEDRFLLGIAGALLSIASAVVLALAISGQIR